MMKFSIPLSEKTDANEPFSETFVVLGASFDLRAGNEGYRPSKDNELNFVESMDKVAQHQGTTVSMEKMEAFGELMEFIARFSCRGPCASTKLKYVCV